MRSLVNWLGVAAVIGLGAACSATTDDGGAGDAVQDQELGANANGQFCGGFGGFLCPTGYSCVDDPSDSCDPMNGGADCGGVCKKDKKPKKSECADPNRVYIGTSPEECAVIKFFCAEGEPFFDECGCGCEIAPQQCGGSVCGAGEYCCNESCGICAPEGGFCTQQFCGAEL